MLDSHYLRGGAGGHLMDMTKLAWKLPTSILRELNCFFFFFGMSRPPVLPSVG